MRSVNIFEYRFFLFFIFFFYDAISINNVMVLIFYVRCVLISDTDLTLSAIFAEFSQPHVLDIMVQGLQNILPFFSLDGEDVI